MDHNIYQRYRIWYKSVYKIFADDTRIYVTDTPENAAVTLNSNVEKKHHLIVSLDLLKP